VKATDSMIKKLFERMDDWRHLPSYQLERRADLFFSLYLKDILNKKLGFSVKDELIPEFPVRKGLIYEKYQNDIKNKNRSYKIDYVAFSEDLKKAILVELKTEKKSINPKQNDYLEVSREKGFPFLLKGIIELFNHPKSSKKKYLSLLKQLELLGQVKIEPELKKMTTSEAIKHTKSNPKAIQGLKTVNETYLVYIQPSKYDFVENQYKRIITFDCLIDFIKNNTNDDISKRFVKSLPKWRDYSAGEMPGN